MAIALGRAGEAVEGGKKRERESRRGYLGKHVVTGPRLAQVMIGSRGWPTLDRSTDRDLES